MKKVKLAAIMIIISISLVGCNNSGVSNSGATNESTTNQNTTNQTETNSGITNNEVVGANKITIDQAKEIALNHANLTSNQVIFSRTELDYDNGIQKYEVEFYYNNREYSYEINANTGDILGYEQD